MSDSEHNFWPTQPVEHNPESGPRQIVEVKKEEVQKKAIPTPAYLRFEVIDQNVPEKLAELTQFLETHYVGDSAGRSRFAYSQQFLAWWLGSQSNNISVGLRIVKADLTEENQRITADLADGELVGYISGVPMKYSYGELNSVGQSVDFLCVHAKLRSQHLAPLLIQEITRRSYKQGIFTAVFTAAFTAKQAKPVIPPVLVTQYFHRLLNPIKLWKCGFCQKPHAVSERDFEQVYKLPYVQSQHQKAFRKMEKKDQVACLALVEEYQSKQYRIQQHFPQQLFQKLFRNIDNVIQCFVYEKAGQILGFTSFYIVDTQMLDPEIRKSYTFIKNGYFFHYAVKDGQQDVDLLALQTLAIHEMKKQSVDVCTCLNICKNEDLIKKLQMDPGDGRLSYHTFNLDWGKDIKNEELGIVLV